MLHDQIFRKIQLHQRLVVAVLIFPLSFVNLPAEYLNLVLLLELDGLYVKVVFDKL